MKVLFPEKVTDVVSDEDAAELIYRLFDGDMEVLTFEFTKKLKADGCFPGIKRMSANRIWRQFHNWNYQKMCIESSEQREKRRDIEKVRNNYISQKRRNVEEILVSLKKQRNY